MIYFDNAASTPLSPGVRQVLLEELEEFGNPSSLHALGFQAEKRMTLARKQVARALSCREDEIVFTSGGTEADNLAMFGAARRMKKRGNRILSSDAEHPAVEECLKKLEEEGFEVIRLSTRGGKISLEEAERFANEKTVLCAVMHTNNETGARFDITSLSRLAKQKNPDCLVFSDGVQGFGKEELVPERMGLDLVSLSSHKIHGPKGVGALYVKKGLVLPPILCGGGQEKGVRNGTENLPGIVAFGKACEEGMKTLSEARKTMTEIGEVILEGLSGVEKGKANLPENRSPHILSLQVSAFPSEVLLHALSERGVFVSSGSACSSHKGKSPVLTNFGLSPKERDHTVRLSFSRFNTAREGREFVKILKEIIG